MQGLHTSNIRSQNNTGARSRAYPTRKLFVQFPESERKSGREKRKGDQVERENKGETKSVCSVAGSVLDLLAVCWTNDCAATAMEKLGWKRLHSTIPTVSLGFLRLETDRGLSNQESLRATKRCWRKSHERKTERLQSSLEPCPTPLFLRPPSFPLDPRAYAYVLRDWAMVVVAENSQSRVRSRVGWLLAFSTTSWLPCRV